MTRREKLHQITLEEILTIARRQISESGTEGLSMNAIAHQMGMSGPALYRYFNSRDDLVAALTSAAGSALQDFLEIIRQEHHSDSPSQRLKSVLLAYRRWAITHPAEYQLLLAGVHAAALVKLEALLEPALVALEEIGPPESLVTDAFWVTWTHLHGWISLEIASRLPPGLEDVEKEYAREIDVFLGLNSGTL